LPQCRLFSLEPGFQDVFARDLFGVARITQGENVPIEPNEVGGLADFDRARLPLRIQHASTRGFDGSDGIRTRLAGR
jgi:hypothetical protein